MLGLFEVLQRFRVIVRTVNQLRDGLLAAGKPEGISLLEGLCDLIEPIMKRLQHIQILRSLPREKDDHLFGLQWLALFKKDALAAQHLRIELIHIGQEECKFRLHLLGRRGQQGQAYFSRCRDIKIMQQAPFGEGPIGPHCEALYLFL